MKKIHFIVVALFAFVSLSSNAQVEVGKVFVKPTVGINVANITKSEGDAKIGLLVGGEIEYGLSKLFSLSGGLFYSMQGTKGTADGVTETVSIDYINVPILFNYYAAPKLALKFGLQPGLKISATDKVSNSSQSASEDIEGLESMAFAIPLGVSYQISDFVIDARYNLGISNVAKEGEGKHSVFSITVAYRLPLK